MKTLFSTLVFALAILIVVPGFAQSEKEIKKDLKKKAMKDARKEAKKLKKDGFKVAPGQLPMDKQIEDTWIKRSETDDKGNKKWFVADARALGETHTAAKMQANEVARENLAGQISTEVKGRIKTSIANHQLDAEEAESLTQSIATFQSVIGTKIGRTTILFEADRAVGTNDEVFITIGYSYADAVKLAKDIIREDLQKQTKIQEEKLDKILDF